jgi:capsid protein
MSAILTANHLLLARAIAKSGKPLSSMFPSATSGPTRTSTAMFPLGSRHENKPADRKALVQKSRFLRRACGLIRGLYEKPVGYSVDGGLIASSDTGDVEFDKAADNYFEEWAQSPIDVTGSWDFYRAQTMLAEEVHTDGEIFALKVRAYWSDRCQFQFLRSHQIGSSLSAKDLPTAQFVDGILPNSLGRAMRYRVLQDPLAGSPTNTAFRDYDAADMLHIREPRLGGLRGLPWAYHGENSAIDILDMGSLAKVSEKLNVALAGVLTKTGAKPGQFGPMVAGGNIFGDSPTNESTSTVPGGTTPGQASGQVSWEAIMGGGAIPVLEDGQTLSPIDLSRKGQQTWIPSAEYFIRDIATGYGVSYEFIWNPEALGGPAARFMLEDLVRFCRRDRRMLVAYFCQPVRDWVIATGIMRGELPECKTGNWKQCLWMSPEEVTIDKGRMGALFKQLLDAGMITLDEWWAMLNKDGRKMRKKRILEISEDLAECTRLGVPYDLYQRGATSGEPDPALVEAVRAALVKQNS